MPISHIREGMGPKIQVLSMPMLVVATYLNTHGSGAKCFALVA